VKLTIVLAAVFAGCATAPTQGHGRVSDLDYTSVPLEPGRTYALQSDEARAEFLRMVRRITDTTTTPRQCSNPVPSDTNIATAGTAVSVPATAASARRFITICNSPENTGTPKIKCREDGTAPVMGLGNAGDVLNVGDCVPYTVTDQQTVSCNTDTNATHALSLECR